MWKGLFLREAVDRLTDSRFAWLWMILEPLGHVALLTSLYVYGFRTRVLAGADTSLFITLGVLGFFLPRNMINGSISAIDSGASLLAFRNVKPFDTVVARLAVESLIGGCVLITLYVLAAFFGFAAAPAEPLKAAYALFALWLGGLGFGVIVSVPGRLVALTRIVRRLVAPLYLFSAVMYPSMSVPHSMRDLLLLNPFVHGIEALRVAFMPNYRVPAGIDPMYLVQWGVAMLFLGLALHVRYENVLAAR